MYILTQSEVAFITLHSQHAVLPILLFSPATRIKMITLRNESVKLLTEKKYCQKKPSPFSGSFAYVGNDLSVSDSVLCSVPIQSGSPVRQMTLCMKGKQLQRETTTNSIGSVVITFKNVPIHSSPWIFTHTFFSNKYALPHLSLCHAGSHSSFHFFFLLTYGPFATYTVSRTTFRNDA